MAALHIYECPYCGKGGCDAWVQQRRYKNTLRVQYFHQECLKKNSIGGLKHGKRISE